MPIDNLAAGNGAVSGAVTAFSPGPWSVSKRRKNLVVNAKGASITDCLFTHSQSSSRARATADECIANARAIAALPDMVAALELIVRSARFDEQYGQYLIDTFALRDATEVFLRVTGRAP